MEGSRGDDPEASVSNVSGRVENDADGPRYAQNEILSALDFVSLLLSGNSAAAQTSMSPDLRQRVPTGSLEGHPVEKRVVSATSGQQLTHISEGWKSESFKSASDKLEQAATRLENEAQRQSRYWEQIAQVKTQGWSVSRLPSNSRAIGIHYGFPESAAQFRNRSFALLQQDELGNLRLDSRSVPDRGSSTGIVIVRNGTVTGSSRSYATPSQPDDDVRNHIKTARDAIFEEEMFYELNREARLIANQGVRTQPGTIEAVIDTQCLFQIKELGAGMTDTELEAGPDDELAESIAINLYLLLLLEHGKSKSRRSKPPPAMSLTPPKASEYAILRPVLMHLRHQAALTVLQGGCALLATTFSKAGLSFEYQLTRVEPVEADSGAVGLRQPAKSQLVMQLNGGRKIELDVETYLGPPIYGTVFRSKDQDYGFVKLSATSLQSLDEAKDYLAYTMTLELMSQTAEFDVTGPHSGEVNLRTSKRTTAAVNLRPERLSLYVTNPAKISYSWRPSGFQSIPRQDIDQPSSFRDVVKRLSNGV